MQGTVGAGAGHWAVLVLAATNPYISAAQEAWACHAHQH